MRARLSAIACLQFLFDKFDISVKNDSIEILFDISSSGSILDCFISMCEKYSLKCILQEIDKKKIAVFEKFPVAIYNGDIFLIVINKIDKSTYSVYDPIENNLIKKKHIEMELEKAKSKTVISFFKNNIEEKYSNHAFTQNILKKNGNIKTVIEKSKKLIETYFSKSSYVALTGSYADGSFDHSSDVDLIIISEYHRNVVKETIKFLNSKFDIYIYPKYNFSDFILYDLKSLNSNLIDRLRKSIIIKDENAFFFKITEKANSIYTIGPKRISNDQLIFLRHSLFGYLEKLKRNSSRETNIIIVNQAFDLILKLNSFITITWLDKRINLVTSEFNLFFFEALNEFYINNSLKKIIKIVENLLEESGSSESNLNTSYCLSNLDSNSITIGVGNVPSFHFFLNNIYFLLKKNYKFLYFYRNNNFNYVGIDYFIVLFNFKKSEKTKIIKKIESLFSSLKHTIPEIFSIYPYNLDKSANHINHAFETNLYFNKVCSNWLNSYTKGIYEQNFIYYFSCSLASFNRISRMELIRYYKLLLKILLTDLFDEKSNNMNQLFYKINGQLAFFEKMYSCRDELWKNLEREINIYFIAGNFQNKYNIYVDQFEKIIPTSVIYNNYYFRTHNYVNNMREYDIINSLEFYKYQKIIAFVMDMLNMSNMDKCFFLFKMYKALKSSSL